MHGRLFYIDLKKSEWKSIIANKYEYSFSRFVPALAASLDCGHECWLIEYDWM